MFRQVICVLPIMHLVYHSDLVTCLFVTWHIIKVSHFSVKCGGMRQFSNIRQKKENLLFYQTCRNPCNRCHPEICSLLFLCSNWKYESYDRRLRNMYVKEWENVVLKLHFFFQITWYRGFLRNNVPQSQSVHTAPSF